MRRRRSHALRRRYGHATVLDRILDRVQSGKSEVTIDTEGYTRDDVDRIMSAARARGLTPSRDRRFVLVRDLRKIGA
jgi:hypothetical protein